MTGRRFSNYICYMTMFFSGVIMTVIGPMLAELANEFNLTLAQSGLMYTAEFAGYTILIILGGILSDKFGKRLLLTSVFVLLIVSLYVFSVSESFYLSLAVIFFAGGLCGPIQSITISILSDLNPAEPDKHISINAVFYGFGAMSGCVDKRTEK
ncbi:MAG: MFS transporter [Eubacteriales bacterium]|nr:MFS transporter [Eubacteriales bacterium]